MTTIPAETVAGAPVSTGLTTELPRRGIIADISILLRRPTNSRFAPVSTGLTTELPRWGSLADIVSAAAILIEAPTQLRAKNRIRADSWWLRGMQARQLKLPNTDETCHAVQVPDKIRLIREN